MNQLAHFFSECIETFKRIDAPAGCVTRDLRVVGQLVRLHFAGDAMLPAVLPALAHLETAYTRAAPPELEIYIWDAASTGAYPPRPPFAAADYRRYGQRALGDDGRFAVLHSPVAGTLFAFDRIGRRGFLWTQDVADLSIYERAAPLQTVLQWAFEPHGWCMVHAAAVGTEAGGVLLVGNSGAGKSTTALACLQQSGLRFLCDDKCMLSLSPAPRVFGVFGAAKLKADMLAALPGYDALVSGWDDKFKAGKSLMQLYPDFRDRMVAEFPIKAVLISTIAHRAQPLLRPASAQDTFRIMGPNTVMWLPGTEANSLRMMSGLVGQVPCYWLELALDPLLNTEAIAQVIHSQS